MVTFGPMHFLQVETGLFDLKTPFHLQMTCRLSCAFPTKLVSVRKAHDGRGMRLAKLLGGKQLVGVCFFPSLPRGFGACRSQAPQGGVRGSRLPCLLTEVLQIHLISFDPIHFYS